MLDQAQSTFDRVLTGISGLPGFKSTKPSTCIDAIPIVGNVTTYVIQSFRTEDGGFVIFLQIVDAEGRERIIIPNKVAQAIYRQRQSLADRSTPTSRAYKARQKELERKRKEKAARKAAWHSRNSTKQ